MLITEPEFKEKIFQIWAWIDQSQITIIPFKWTSRLSKAEGEVAQSRPTLCDPLDCSLPGSSSMAFPRQEYWRGLPFPSPGNLPEPGLEPRSPALPADALLLWATGAFAMLILVPWQRAKLYLTSDGSHFRVCWIFTDTVHAPPAGAKKADYGWQGRIITLLSTEN